jgi:hypothetical protein
VLVRSGARLWYSIGMLLVRQIVLVLSETVLVLVLDWTRMSEPIFDHDRLDRYRLSIVSMLTRLIQRTATVAEDSVEYEHELYLLTC